MYGIKIWEIESLLVNDMTLGWMNLKNNVAEIKGHKVCEHIYLELKLITNLYIHVF